MKMPTVVGIFIFISKENFMLSYENFSANRYENAKFELLLAFSYLLAGKISCSAELSMAKKFITSGPYLSHT